MCYYKIILHIFSEFIWNNTHTFKELLPNKRNTFSEFMSNITDTLTELLPNITTHCFRHQPILKFSESYWQTILHTFPDIKQYWHFQRVTGRQYCTHFKRLHQTIVKFSESCWQTKLQTFPDFISLSRKYYTHF